MLLSPIHCCVTKPPSLLSGELPLHSNRLYVYTVCCRRGGQCFSVLRTRHTDVVGDSSERSYVTEKGHNVPFLRTRDLDIRCEGQTLQIVNSIEYLGTIICNDGRIEQEVLNRTKKAVSAYYEICNTVVGKREISTKTKMQIYNGRKYLYYNFMKNCIMINKSYLIL